MSTGTESLSAIPTAVLAAAATAVLSIRAPHAVDNSGHDGIDPDHLDRYQFSDLAINSLLVAEIIVELETRLNTLLELRPGTRLETLADLRVALYPTRMS